MSPTRIRALALGSVAALVSVIVFAAPAAAHEDLLASTPATGEQLASAPDNVSLTFSAEVLTIGAAVIVVDQSGRDWVAGEPIVTEGVVTAPLADDLPEAGYEIRWRVVSADGHPISGLIPFSVGDAEPLERAAAAPSSGDAASTEQSTQDLSARQDGTVLRVVLVGLGGAVLALAVFTLIFFFRRRSRAGDSGDEDTPRAGNISERH